MWEAASYTYVTDFTNRFVTAPCANRQVDVTFRKVTSLLRLLGFSVTNRLLTRILDALLLYRVAGMGYQKSRKSVPP